ncbi:hypothetical protein ZIOFF_060108 [Zingiber officinale]|uniref:dUTP diphosphatase n=1 Tax=Zingiber officinale TaxID=94328 RepID=A0A8J5F866_ZINOF|nr:hypothetical protein ZIOFF_060108 [Zingiber officinale]
MPFGLKNAPAIFQRKMDNCFRGTEEFIAIYIDDILVFSDTYEAHKRHLKAFITICYSRILSKKILETKSESLTEIRALRRWLGILNYARAYIPNLGKTLGPLYSKTSVKGERRMNTQDWKIIEQIKQQVQNLPDLEIPPPDAIILLETDGCMEGWGGICKWKTSKGEPRTSEKICAYASGRFLPCACGRDAALLVSHTSRNPGRHFYKCSTDTCHSWYWADLIENYVQQRLNMEAPLAQEPINWVNIEQHGYWDNDPIWEEPGLGEPEVIKPTQRLMTRRKILHSSTSTWTEADVLSSSVNIQSIIAAMEIDLAEGHQLIYVMPDIMLTIKDFFRHIQISIQTHGYESWEGAEANLLVTRSITARLSNTPNVGFAFRVEKVAEYLRSKGVKAIDATKHSATKFQGSQWNLRPSRVILPMQPSSLLSSTNYDGSTSIQFGGYQPAVSSKAPLYTKEDDETDEEHIVSVITIIDDSLDDYPVLIAPNALLQDYPALAAFEDSLLQSMVGEDEESEDEESEEEALSKILEETTISSQRSRYNINTTLDDYPELQNIERILSTGESAISNYRPPQDEEMDIPGYAPAGSSRGWAGIEEANLAGKRPKKWENNSEWFQLPSANAKRGSVFVMPYDFDPKVFDRWESSTLIHLADKNFELPKDKILYIENLLGESEKKAFVTWRMKYQEEFEDLKKQAMGNNGTQNVLNQMRLIFYLENPKVGTTGEQDSAYKTLKSLVCNEMTDKAVYRYMNDYFHLASKSGRMWVNEELSTEFFTKLPRPLGDRVEKAFKERHPTNTIGVVPRIAFTRQFLKDMCQEALFQSQLKKMNFCGNTPVHGVYGKNKEKAGKKFGARKSTTYKGKPHDSHVRIGKAKHLALRKKNCKCYACGETGHYASECTNPRKIIKRVAILDSLELQEGMEVVSVGMNESDLSDIYSVSEGEDLPYQPEEFDIFMLRQTDISQETLKIRRTHPLAFLPQRKTEGAAGYDLATCEGCVLTPHSHAILNTGISIKLPEGTYGRIAPRSGLSAKGIFINGGVIDADFRGSIQVILFNFSFENILFNIGDNIAQLIIEKIALPEVEEVQFLDQTPRGSRSFGSTDKQEEKKVSAAFKPVPIPINMLQVIEDEPSEYLIGESEWRSQMRVSRKEYLCQHDWSYDETTAADCRDCKLEARAGNRIDCRKCKLIICSLCTYHCFKISWPSTIRTQMKKTDWKSLSALQSNLIQKFIRRENELEEEVKNLRQQISGMEELAIIQEAPSEYERELTEV